MMKKMVLSFILLLSISFASSVSLDIEINDSFSVGDKIYFDYSMLSEEGGFFEYIVDVSCPYYPIALIEIKRVNLEPGILFENRYVYFDEVFDGAGSQFCNATVYIINSEFYKIESFYIDINYIEIEEENFIYDEVLGGDEEVNYIDMRTFDGLRNDDILPESKSQDLKSLGRKYITIIVLRFLALFGFLIFLFIIIKNKKIKKHKNHHKRK